MCGYAASQAVLLFSLFAIVHRKYICTYKFPLFAVPISSEAAVANESSLVDRCPPDIVHPRWPDSPICHSHRRMGNKPGKTRKPRALSGKITIKADDGRGNRVCQGKIKSYLFFLLYICLLKFPLSRWCTFHLKMLVCIAIMPINQLAANGCKMSVPNAVYSPKNAHLRI